MRFKFQKFFSKKTNLIISIVALVECIMLIGMTSFSWIETASSLVIKGDTLWVTDGRNYEYRYDSEDNKLVDLSSYFINSEHFSFAKASSADANNFYFPYVVNDSVKYRTGDTTDYNVTYYNFDFKATGGSASFFFADEEMFSFLDKSFTDKDGNKVDVSSDDKKAFLNAFRIAVTTNGVTKIYSKEGTTYSAYNGTGNVDVSPTAFSTALYEKNKSTDMLFTSGNDGVYVNVKIWLEEKDLKFQGLTANVKEALLGAAIDVNIKLVSQELAFKTLSFKDYTLSTKDNNSRDRMYYVNDGVYYPMVKTLSTSNYYTWVTCDDSGTPFEIIPSDSDFNVNKGYFTFGHKKGTGFEEVYRWNLGFDSVTETFNAISLTKVSDTNVVGYGFWDDVPLTRIQFVDRTTYASDVKFNAGASKFIALDQIYTVVDDIKVKLNYFNDSDSYAAFIPTSWLNSELTFEYTKTKYYDSSNVAVRWNAPIQSSSTTYTALGYSDNKLLSALSNVDGIGTWGEVERINLSTELIDTIVLNQDKELFRVGFDSTMLYMASDRHNPLSYYAYVPVDKYLTFDYGKLGVNDQIKCEAGHILNNCSTYYLTELVDSEIKGLWNLALVVDGTTDNLINVTLNNTLTTGASLTYTVNSTPQTPIKMTKVDNFRWRTGDLTKETLIRFTWTAYSKDKGYVDTIFEYDVNSAIDGIYYLTVTEDGTVIPAKTN